MEEKNKKRIEELRGEQARLQAQCYLMKVGLEANEKQLALIGAVLAELEAEKTPATPEPKLKEETPDVS